MRDIEGRVTGNRRVLPGYFRLEVRLGQPMGGFTPGQFVMLQVPSDEVFLRRPFSIYSMERNLLTIVYRVAGKGTAALSRIRPPARVMVLGPLGKGFSVASGARPVLVAGGIGVAGIRALWKRLGARHPLFYGCTGRAELKLLGDMAGPGTHVATIDGTAGFKGTVVELLAEHLRVLRQPVQVFACGPEGMFRSLRSLLEPGHLPCQVSVEERMACGLGLCFGCVKKTQDESDPYKRVCLEGPVFDLWQLSL